MAYSVELKEKVLSLRMQGYSLKELARMTGVAKGTLSDWFRDVELSAAAKERLLTCVSAGQLAAAHTKKAKSDARDKDLLEMAAIEASSHAMSLSAKRILCALIYFCEGAKDPGSIAFTNSSKELTLLFIDLLVEGFGVDRAKIVARLHLHEYHNIEEETKSWSEALHLQLSQFRKPYLKPHTGKRRRENYPGCISIVYHNTITARKLLFLAKSFMQKGA